MQPLAECKVTRYLVTLIFAHKSALTAQPLHTIGKEVRFWTYARSSRKEPGQAMAKENKVILHGQVMSNKIQGLDAQPEKARMFLKVLRRPSSPGQVYANALKTDFPKIESRNEDYIKAMKVLKKGDMVEVKGVFTTREVLKVTTCPFCHTVNESEGNDAYITPIYIRRSEQELSDEECFELLKERAEVSNGVMLLGALCRDPVRYTDEQGREYAQYQLAVGRKYRIPEKDQEDVRTDYPWIKTFGQQALKDAEGLHTGSWVYIDGAVQTRQIRRTTICSKCGSEYPWADMVMEIVPYSTEYLANCDFPEALGHDEFAVEDGSL